LIGKLFVCATPIGNLSDITSRLHEIFHQIDYLLAENISKAQILQKHFKTKLPVIKLEKNTEEKQFSKILKLLHKGRNLALISEAGTPNIADPGAHLIKKLHQEKIIISPIPGVSAVTSLISISGILANQFIFIGFFPKKAQEADKYFQASIKTQTPIFFFETAKRIQKTLNLLNKNYHISEIIVARELTKKFEQYFIGSLDHVLKELSKANIKGEWCVFLKCKNISQTEIDLEIIKKLKAQGLSKKQILYIGKEILGYTKNKLYKNLITK
jgi:16S rRNA (cytidine1402-2'-O)-methyltransferase